MSFDYSKGSLMMEFKTAGAKAPVVAEFKKTFGLSESDFDMTAGFVPMCDGLGSTFIAIVSPEAGKKIEDSKHPDFIRLYGAPRIEGF